jgi:hypothetical protein
MLATVGENKSTSRGNRQGKQDVRYTHIYIYIYALATIWQKMACQKAAKGFRGRCRDPPG